MTRSSSFPFGWIFGSVVDRSVGMECPFGSGMGDSGMVRPQTCGQGASPAAACDVARELGDGTGEIGRVVRGVVLPTLVRG